MTGQMTNDTMTKEFPMPSAQETVRTSVVPSSCGCDRSSRDWSFIGHWSLCHWSFIIWSFILAAILLVSGCSKHSAPATDVLAKVGSAEIRLADFNHEVERRAKANQPVVSAEALLDEMIGRELLLLKASQAGLSNDPEVRRAVQAVLINKFKERDMKPKLDNVEVTADEIRARYEGNLQQYTTPAKARLAMLYLQTD